MRVHNLPIMSLMLLCVGFLTSQTYGVAVMSIDLGSEWMKVAIVSPGVPMEIALNKESKRKTAVMISFRDGERAFGEDAQVAGIRFPKTTYAYLLDLIGKSINNPMVDLYKKRFPFNILETDKERSGIMFRIDEDTTFTPEELLAQIMHKAKEYAETSAGQKIKEAVITVPGFFNQAERRALLQAAELADIKVLQLINDYLAVALNYGIFHHKEINDTAHYIMFYDMGASSTTATVVAYQNIKSKDKGFVEVHPQVSILGVGYDRTLGGLEMQIRLRDHLARQFDTLKKTKQSAFGNPKAMAKLFKEAGRVKNVLSANNDHYAQVEGLVEEHDFRLQVTREKFEEICADLFDRVANPIKIALETSGLTMDLISQVVLVGAGTRVPKVQEKLSEFVKTELSKNINTDEAAALGAVYKAAELSQGFKVKKFITKDAVLFPFQITFDRTIDNKLKQIRRTLFSRMNHYPQKKIITFNKHQKDFTFYVNYADLDYLSPHEIQALGHQNVTIISVGGVPEALGKHAKEKAESKGVKAHFSLDESGILSLVNIELVSEKASTINDEEEGSEGGEKPEEAPKEDVKPVHEEPDYPGLKEETEEKEKIKNETKQAGKAENITEKADKDKKIAIITLKEPIKSEQMQLGPEIMNSERFLKSLQRLKELDAQDAKKAQRESALNNLESFVIDAQQKLDSDEYQVAANPEEREKIKTACSEISEWLYEDGLDASAETYEEKLSELQKLTKDLYERVFEHKERPEALKGMFAMLNASRTFLNNMRTLNVSSEIFTPIEIETLEKVINESQEYYDTVVQVTAETAPNLPVVYKVRDIANKMAVLDREVKYLVNKAKIWRPKQETPEKGENTTNSGDSETESKTSEKAESEKEGSETVEEPSELPASDSTKSEDEKHEDDHSEL